MRPRTMAPANKQYTIREFSYFFCKEDGEKSADNCKLDRQTFEEIKKFILENKETGLDETLELLSLTSKSGYGEIIKAQNYVGLIQTKSGAMIEILPKIYKGKNKLGIDECRKQLIRMLSVLKEAPFKRSQSADLDTAAGTLYEIFMHMFMDEFTQLQRKGLRSDYLPVEENLPYLKGKLQLAQHLKHNAAHQERFYVQYDEYLRNRPENRLIKATLLFLAGKATSSLLQQRIRQGLFIMDGIDASAAIEKDFNLCKMDRSMAAYARILQWCRVFLRKETFSSYQGSTVAFALLFPMEKVYESYVAHWVRASLPDSWEFSKQEKLHHLIEKPKTGFLLQPDIVLRQRQEREPGKRDVIIVDTKWKRLKYNSSLFGISQADVYQMFAYAQKYGARKVVLAYPRTDGAPEFSSEELKYCFSSECSCKNLKYYFSVETPSKGNCELQIVFIDLARENEKCIEEIVNAYQEIT